jgi:NAD(P)-dependent dehydrogenase (short-subunit alcohol dehydrogenase family)
MVPPRNDGPRRQLSGFSRLSEDNVDRLKGKVAIVTGAAQGIGAEYARALAAEGAAVALADVADPQTVGEQIKAAGGQAIARVTDVSDAGSVTELVRLCASEFGRVDILVNNAGMFGSLALQPFEQIDSREFDAVMRVNVRGVFECSRAVAPLMREQNYGKIVNIASGTVFKGTPMLLHYVASKGAVVAMTRCLARELGGDGVRVNCLAPGLTMSESVLNNPAWTESIIAGNMASRAIKREAMPEDMIGALVFLCSPESDFITGQTIVVDGGSVMH